MRTFLKNTAFLLAYMMMSPVANAESSQQVGDYVVHFNVLSTESLPPKVAKAYGIKRSKNRGFLNVSVLKKGSGFEGVEAKINVIAVNLVGQLRTLDMRKITEQNAVYYVSEFSVSHLERFTFTITVTTADNITDKIKVKHQFFTN